jgi:hypothetical protein
MHRANVLWAMHAYAYMCLHLRAVRLPHRRHARFTRQKVFALEDRAEHVKEQLEAALSDVAALHARIARLEGERDEARVRCKVCFSEEPPDLRRLPCGHVTCAGCIGQLRVRECPFCRKSFAGASHKTLVVYM